MEYEWNALDGVLHTMQSLQYSEVLSATAAQTHLRTDDKRKQHTVERAMILLS